MADEMAKRQEKPLSRREEMNPYGTMREMMENMIDDFLSDWRVMRPRQLEWRMEQFKPFVDVIDEERQIRVEAETPGMGPEDLEITVTEDALTLRGEKKQEQEAPGTRYRERSFGAFERTIALPHLIDKDNVQAKFKNGLLSIIMPKSKHAQSRKIEIQPEPNQRQVSPPGANIQAQSGQTLSEAEEDVLEGAGLA